MKTSKKVDLYLINTNYPYGKTETFLENEIKFISPFFNKIYVFPLNYPSKDFYLRDVPHNVSYFPVSLDKSYTKRILKFIFKISPVKDHIYDLKNLFKSGNGHYKDKIKRWFLSLMVDRAFYKSDHFNFITNNIQSDDILYFYWGSSKSKYSKLFNHPKTYIRVHGREVDFPRNHNYIVLFNKIFNNPNANFLSISNRVKHQVLNYYPDANIHINRLGTFDQGLSIQPDSNKPIRIVSCSNIIPLKRVHLIVLALKKINNLEIEWVHFGDGILFEEIKASSNKLSRNIKPILKGRVTNNEVLNYYKNNYIDLFVNISTNEGIPVSIMEAFSFGIPTFATNVGATGELVNEFNGTLVQKQFAIDELSNVIKNCRTKEHTIKRLEARQTWERLCNAESNYMELVDILHL